MNKRMALSLGIGVLALGYRLLNWFAGVPAPAPSAPVTTADALPPAVPAAIPFDPEVFAPKALPPMRRDPFASVPETTPSSTRGDQPAK